MAQCDATDTASFFKRAARKSTEITVGFQGVNISILSLNLILDSCFPILIIFLPHFYPLILNVFYLPVLYVLILFGTYRDK